MEYSDPFIFPLLTITDVNPLLKKDDKIFSYQINALTPDRQRLTMYENKGLDLTVYIGQKVECLMEITRGSFEYKDEDGKKPEDASIFQYKWLKRPYEYFPELVKLREGLDGANDVEEDSITKSFETSATKFFKEWGLNGLNIGIYQAKPVLSSQYGIFLLNEYEFEEEIDLLELDQEVFIKIEEIYLRGIRPYQPKKKNILFEEKVKEPERDDEYVDKKRRWFDF